MYTSGIPLYGNSDNTITKYVATSHQYFKVIGVGVNHSFVRKRLFVLSLSILKFCSRIINLFFFAQILCNLCLKYMVRGNSYNFAEETNMLPFHSRKISEKPRSYVFYTIYKIRNQKNHSIFMSHSIVTIRTVSATFCQP